MKKLYVFIIALFLFSNTVKAKERVDVSLSKCVDGDTAWFFIGEKNTKVRFLAIDTPESTNRIDPYGKEASAYTCNILKDSQKIELEYDNASDKTDKYGRDLAWIFVDGKLLQELIIENGYGKVAYLYGDYQYTNILENAEKKAKENKVGIFGDLQEEQINYFYLGICFIIILIICVFSTKTRKKVIRKTKNHIKSQLKKSYRNL